MTFLEYVATRLMGPPAWRSNGRSVWLCPRHNDNSPSFSTRPPKDGFKDRFQCFGCGFWGDVFDLVKEFYPGEDYGQRRARVAAFRIDYEREGVPEQAHAVLSHRGLGSTKSTEKSPNSMEASSAFFEFKKDVEEWETSEALALQVLKQFRQRCEDNGVPMEVALQSWQNFEDWSNGIELDHLAECDDPECDWAVCRGARGLPPIVPLTTAEHDAIRSEKRQRMERVRKAIHKHPVPGGRRR